MKVVVLVEVYLPGYRSGGPVRTIANLVERLGDRIDFSIVTGDRDRGEAGPWPDVALGRWTQRGNARCMYVKRGHWHHRTVRRALRGQPYDVLYINSLFSRRFSIEPLLMRRLGMLPRTPLIVAPRGELSQGALGLKSTKKRAFLAFARLLRLYDGVLWEATNDEEAHQIRRHIGPDVPIRLAPNLSATSMLATAPPVRNKRAGTVDLAFLSRIAPMKNLLGAIELIDGLNGEIGFDIYGPVADERYWRRCSRAMGALSPNVRAEHKGPVPFGSAHQVLTNYDALILPTLGENFGHVVLEALAAGCPVIVSDRTPWRGLAEAGAGWDLPLDDRGRWRAALQECVDMPADQHRELAAGARAYAEKVVGDPAAESLNLALFEAAVAGAGVSP